MIGEIPQALVYTFFESFARFECAMKESDCCGRGRNNRAEPNWTKLAERLGPLLAAQQGRKLGFAMAYLLSKPPEVQVFRDGRAVFVKTPLRGENDGQRVLDALKRVRNNLFHGGKHTHHSPEERDPSLLECALVVLEAIADLDVNLSAVYRGQF